MLGLPETVDPVEVVWTALSAIAVVFSASAWRRARGDLAYVRRSRRRNLGRAFVEDVRNARGRLIVALCLTVAGVVAMTYAAPGPRNVAGWIVVALIHGAPVYLVWRSISEAVTRRAILRDLERRNDPGGEA
jgi:hypothetical protein